jgi:hypothetical protein
LRNWSQCLSKRDCCLLTCSADLEEDRLTSTRSNVGGPLAIGIAGLLLGIASLVGNVVWNCSTCGWDLDGVPLHQAVLIAAVPYAIGPGGVLAIGLWAALARTKAAYWTLAMWTTGLALPWLYLLSA